MFSCLFVVYLFVCFSATELAEEAQVAVYIALNDKREEGTFEWEDGSPVNNVFNVHQLC